MFHPCKKLQQRIGVDVCNWKSQLPDPESNCYDCSEWVASISDLIMIICEECGFLTIIIRERVVCPKCKCVIIEEEEEDGG